MIKKYLLLGVLAALTACGNGNNLEEPLVSCTTVFTASSIELVIQDEITDTNICSADISLINENSEVVDESVYTLEESENCTYSISQFGSSYESAKLEISANSYQTGVSETFDVLTSSCGGATFPVIQLLVKLQPQ